MDFGPASGDVVAEGGDGDDGAADVDGHLDDIGPDDRSHAAFEGVEQRKSKEMMAIESTSRVPIAIPTTMETAKTRTPSAAARVSRKSSAVTLCSVCPKRLSISW